MTLLYNVAILTTLTSLTNALAQCYLRDGSPAPSNYAPCSILATGEEGSNTHCCDWVNSDACLSSGLCLYPLGGVVGMLNADGCTDKTMQDSSCQPFCNGVDSGSQGYLRVVPCEDGTFCCTAGQDASCCSGDADARFALRVGNVVNVTERSTLFSGTGTVTTDVEGTKTVTVVEGSGTSTSAAATQVKKNATSSANASASGGAELSNDGRVVGVVVASVLLGGFLVIFFAAI